MLLFIKKNSYLAILLFTVNTYPMAQPIARVTTHITEKTATLTRLTPELSQLIADLNALKEATEDALVEATDGLRAILQSLLEVPIGNINDQLSKRQQALDAIAALRAKAFEEPTKETGLYTQYLAQVLNGLKDANEALSAAKPEQVDANTKLTYYGISKDEKKIREQEQFRRIAI